MLCPNDLVSILLAILFGGLIGLEREISAKPAGLRTNILICLGATIFTLISRKMGLFGEGSITRIAAGVVTGIGFLGAGAVIQDRRGVHGLTTAATIWLVASLGMAIGGGYHSLAAIGTISAIVVLIGLRRFERHLARYRQKRNIENNSDPQNQ